MIKSYLIIYSYGQQSGFGHQNRARIIKNYITKNIKSKVTVASISDKDVKKTNIGKNILKIINSKKINILILDLNYFHIKQKNKIIKTLNFIKKKGIKIVGVDSLRNFYKFLDVIWIPSPSKKKNLISKNIIYGVDKMIFNRYRFAYSKLKKITFLVGGSKNKKVSEKLPKIIEKNIPKEFKLIWIKYGFSHQPKIIDKKRWLIYNSKNSLKNIFKNSGFVFSLYGLSFFESLNCGIPSVALCTKKNYKKDYEEINFFKKKKIFFIETNIYKAVKKLVDLISNNKMSQFYSIRSKKYLNNYNYSFLKKI
jgi:hypothetical protein